MKKITLLLLAALAMPMAMNAETKSYVQQNKKAANVVASTTPTAVKATKSVKYVYGTKADVPEGYASVTLTAGDVWSDGSGYQMLLDADATAYGTLFAETGPLTTSGDADAATYAEFEYKIPENADGALTTANIVMNSSVTILIPAGTYDWCITNPTPGDRMWIASQNGTVGGRADNYEFVSGVGYEFVVTLGSNGNDQVDLVVDDPTAPQIPTELAVDPVSVDGTSATIEWVAGENNASWNLRWRPYTDPSLLSPSWTLPYPGYESEIEGWYIIDADQDGNNWGLYYTSDAQDDLCFGSESYSSSTWEALTPDNWLITPAVGMGGTLTFKTWNSSASYLDQIQVYYAPAEWEGVEDFVAISDVIVPGTEPEEYEIDLSEYEGAGCIAFRHYGVADMMRIFVDDITIDVPGGINPADLPEWTVVENAENPYVLEGLVPETEYEVQVQGVGADGRTTDWTESTRFITEASGEQPQPQTAGTYLVGTFNDWSVNEDYAFVGETGNQVQFEATEWWGAEFKVVTVDEEGNWTWYGGADDNNVGYFLVTDELLNHHLTLCDGANFRVPEKGIYNVILDWNRSEPENIVVTRLMTGISTINSDNTVDNNWYNLQGQKMNGMPTVPGIYINGGKKVIVK